MDGRNGRDSGRDAGSKGRSIAGFEDLSELEKVPLSLALEVEKRKQRKAGVWAGEVRIEERSGGMRGYGTMSSAGTQEMLGMAAFGGV